MQQVQTTFQKDCKLKKPYSLGPYSKIKGNKQAIRITEGCVWNCPNCHEPTEIKIFGIPKIERNEVLIFDMNLLCKPEALEIINLLGTT
jgi:pyruvate-formate lyase-activating enzyme